MIFCWVFPFNDSAGFLARQILRFRRRSGMAGGVAVKNPKIHEMLIAYAQNHRDSDTVIPPQFFS